MSQGGGGQGQSLNLFLTKETTEERVSELHSIAFNDPWLHSLYYVHSLDEDSVHKLNVPACAACEG